VLIGTLGVCIPTVGAHYLMVRQARGRGTAAGVRVVAFRVTGAAAGRGAGLEAVVRAAARPITLVLVHTRCLCIPAVGGGCDMVRLTGPTAIAGVGIVTCTGAAAATGRARCCWRVRAQASAGVAGARHMTLVKRRADHGVAALTATALT